MLHQLADLLPPDLLDTTVSALLKNDDQVGQRAQAGALIKALSNHPMLFMSVHPHSLSVPSFHICHGDGVVATPASAIVDDGNGNRLRADVAILLCLSIDGPGTERTIFVDSDFGRCALTLQAGDCVVLSASATVRCVALSSSAMIFAHLWAQSLVRDAAVREVLYELATTEAFAGIVPAMTHEDHYTLQRCYQDLLRMYAEP